MSRGSDLVASISIFIGLVAVMLSLRRPQDTGLRWFAAGCVVWGLRNLLYLNPTLPGKGYAAEMFLTFGVVFCGVSMAICALYAAALARPATVRWLRNGLLALFIAFCFSMLLPVLATPTRALSFAGTMVAMGLAAWVLLRKRAQASGVSQTVQTLLGLAVLGQIVAGSFDFGIVLGLRPPGSAAQAFWGFSILVLALAVISGARIVAALGRAENANAELEQRVADKNAQLQRSYAAVRDTELLAERRQARAHERERLNREMHDGLGAQLITALRGVERGALSKDQVAHILQEGLDELRLLMDASDLGRSLHGALVAWRSRWDMRLGALGIQLHWTLDEALETVDLSSDASLQVMRVLQEATTNAVKHARATELRVRAQVQEGDLLMEVADNGQGLPTAVPSGDGRGLHNMQQRAQQLRAQLLVQSPWHEGHGTCVRLRVPLGGMPSSQPMPL